MQRLDGCCRGVDEVDATDCKISVSWHNIFNGGFILTTAAFVFDDSLSKPKNGPPSSDSAELALS